MKFLIDENVHHGILRVLSRLGHDAKSSPKGISNGKVLALAVSEKRVLVTHDSDFLVHSSGSNHFGIILVKIPTKEFEKLKKAIQNILKAKPKESNFESKLFVLSESTFKEG